MMLFLYENERPTSSCQDKSETLGVPCERDEILTYLITGMLNKQIGHELNISERTVKAHRKQVLAKIVNSIAELVLLTVKAGVEPANVSY